MQSCFGTVCSEVKKKMEIHYFACTFFCRNIVFVWPEAHEVRVLLPKSLAA
jgi:hypothetical protein